MTENVTYCDKHVSSRKCIFCSASSASRRRRSVPKVFPLFFYVKMTYIPEDGHRRWAEEATSHQGARGAWRAQVGCAHLVAPLWYLLAPIFLIYSIKNLREVSAHLELCRIGSLT